MRWTTLAGLGRLIGPALLAGFGLALSLPPFGFWILAFPSAALLWWRLRGLRWPTRLAVGWTAGLGLFVPSLWWVTAFNVYGGIVLMVVEALALAFASTVVPRGLGRTPTLVGAMVLMEALRGIWPFGGLPMGSVALGQASGPLADAARLGGPLLLVALVWLAGAGLGLLTECALTWARALGERMWGPAPRLTGRIVAAATALAIVCALGIWGGASSDGGNAVSTLRVAAVQGGGVRGLSKSQVPPQTVFNAQVQATNEIPRLDHGIPPSLVLWPEDVVSLDDLLDSDPVKGVLAAMAVRADATLVVGVTETVSSTRFRNEIVAFSPSGHIVGRFEKVHRVPFGEYVPFRGFFKHLASLAGVPQDAIPGHGNGVIRTPAAPLGAMVSYEVFFAERGWLPTRAGAQLLIVPTNTSSYATSQVPCQEVAAARLQAISEGRDLVQAAPTGFSSFIDHDGRVLARSSLGARDVLIRDVALRTGRTVYQRAGDLPVLVGAGLLVVLGWLLALMHSERMGDALQERWARTTGSKRRRRR